MLKQRVITALVLLAVLLPALFYSDPLPFRLIVLLTITAGAWEWGQLNGLYGVSALATGLVGLLAGLFTWWSGWLDIPLPLLWLVASTLWVLCSVALLHMGSAGWHKVAAPLRWCGGILALWVAGIAIVQAHQMGINFLLSVLLLVWVADIFAYFSGRTFGLRFTKTKLAPNISPGKTWEGVWGGALAVMLLALVWVWGDMANQVQTLSLYSHIYQKGWWLLVIVALCMTAMNVIGDLLESLIKRSAGVKDSSQLLPGHGGVLDRIDAMLPVLPLAMMLVTWL